MFYNFSYNPNGWTSSYSAGADLYSSILLYFRSLSVPLLIHAGGPAIVIQVAANCPRKRHAYVFGREGEGGGGEVNYICSAEIFLNSGSTFANDIFLNPAQHPAPDPAAYVSRGLSIKMSRMLN